MTQLRLCLHLCLGAATAAICCQAAQAQPARGPMMLRQAGALETRSAATLTRWPDAIVCHFSRSTSGADAWTSQPSGGGPSASFTVVARLTLAPGRDGLYRYSVGAIPNGAAWMSLGNGQDVAPVLAFHADGGFAGARAGDCTGRSIDQLTAAGQTER